MSRFRVGFVPGVTPDKWSRAWADRMPRRPLELVPLEDRDAVSLVRSGELDMCLVRLPVDRDGLHLIPLYDEQPVVLVAKEHLVTVAEEVTTQDLADEQLVLPHESGWKPEVTQLDFPPMSLREAIEVVAAGTGVLVVPMSVARLHHRRDVTFRPVTDLPTTKIGLAWLVDNDDPRIQDFIGIVRGRTERSSRG